MTDAIRKKHVIQNDYIKRKQGNEPYLCQSIHSVISVAEVDRLFAELDEARDHEKTLLKAVQVAYRKHHLNDDSIGWEELSTVLLVALCSAMGDDNYQAWMKQILKGGGDE